MIDLSDVRDLEQEGVLRNIEISQSWSAGVQDAFTNVRRDILLQGVIVRLERLEEVVADLLSKNKLKEANHV